MNTWPITGKCQICGKTPLALGINSTKTCTLCEPCDRRNNPYYYLERVAPLRTFETPPPLFKAVTDVTKTSHKTLGVYLSFLEAKQALDDLLEEYHEEIAFEADHHHIALNNAFRTTTKVIII